MSMEINGNYSYFKTNYAEQMEEKQSLDKAEKTKGQNDIKTSDKMSVPHDEYISSEKSGEKPSGLYHLRQDENGNRKVFFNDPNKVSHIDEKEQPKVNKDNPEKPAEKCTTNTDKVDREIEKLKEKRQQLEQQIRSASGDEKKIRELEKKLAQVENELSQKDNDTYRRQNALVSQ